MKGVGRYLLLGFILATLVGCNTSRKQVLASGSQVEIRNYQTRTYDTDDKIKALRAVMATLQDLGFVIDKADDVIGIVSATKLQGYALSMSISVRPKGQQMEVRANAQFNLKAVEEPGPYQDFFASLDKGMFLDYNLLTDSASTQQSRLKSNPDSGAGPDEGAFAYYGQAEKEISSDTYDPNLWARALVLAEGDEKKRNARYIELRAEQLYEKNTASTSSLSQNQPAQYNIQPVPVARVRPRDDQSILDNDAIRGTYYSDITGIHGLKADGAKITFQQNGDRITGTNVSRQDNAINGTRDGNTIKFKYWTQWREYTGTWKISPDGRRLDGSFENINGYGGKWVLTRM